MNTELLKKLGNIDQIAGIRETTLLRGRGQGVRLAEFYNAAGLRFTVLPDRCMDLYDLSYKGINLSFHSKNGLTSPLSFNPMEGEFFEQWPGGAMVTCGLDNAGGPCNNDGTFPLHGRIGHTPATQFGVDAHWENDDYVLTSSGEVHETQLFGRHLSLRRKIQTSLYAKSLRIDDLITNHEAEAEPYLLLYHINFGYPLLQEDSKVAVSQNLSSKAITEFAPGYETMQAPVDGQEEELYFHTVTKGNTATAVIFNERLGLGAYVRFDTTNLPGLLQWKRMKSHDYALGLEPCNTYGCNREQLIKQEREALVPPYSCVETHLEIGVLDGNDEIADFLNNL